MIQNRFNTSNKDFITMCAFWNRAQSSDQEEANQVREELYRNRGKEIIEFFTKIASNDPSVNVNDVIGNAIEGIRMKPIDRSVSKYSIPLALCLLAKDDIYSIGIFQSSKKYEGKSQGIISAKNVLQMIPGVKEINDLGSKIPGIKSDFSEEMVKEYGIRPSYDVTLTQFEINGMNFSFCFIASTGVVPKEVLKKLRADFYEAMEEKITLSKKILITETAVFSRNKEKMMRFPMVVEKEPGFFG